MHLARSSCGKQAALATPCDDRKRSRAASEKTDSPTAMPAPSAMTATAAQEQNPTFKVVSRLITAAVSPTAPTEMNVTVPEAKKEVARCRRRIGEVEALNLLQRMERDGGLPLVGETNAAAALSHLSEFAEAQVQRQAAGLVSNTRKQETKALAAQLVQAHEKGVRLTVDAAAAGGSVTRDLVLQLHRALADSAAGKQKAQVRPGELRTTEVKIGDQKCLPPSLVPWAVDKMLTAVNLVLARSDVDMFGKAAFLLVGLVAVHPFVDGNGRVGRLLMNFALLRGRLPFVICLCPTPETRTLLNSTIRSVLQGAPVRSLANFIALQCAQAWNAAEEYVADQRRRQKELTTVTVPQLLEQVKRESCMICLAESPDIVTLCCACPVHVGCIAEWLASNSSCVQCRGTLTLPPPPPARQSSRESSFSDFS